MSDEDGKIEFSSERIKRGQHQFSTESASSVRQVRQNRLLFPVGEDVSTTKYVLLEDSATVSTSFIRKSTCGNFEALAELVGRDTEVCYNNKSNDGILGSFDNVVIVVKEGKKHRHKNFILMNMSNFGASLHNRIVRNVMKLKGREVQAGGFGSLGTSGQFC